MSGNKNFRRMLSPEVYRWLWEILAPPTRMTPSVTQR